MEMEKKNNNKKKNEKRGVGCKKGGMLCPVHKYLCKDRQLWVEIDTRSLFLFHVSFISCFIVKC